MTKSPLTKSMQGTGGWRDGNTCLVDSVTAAVSPVELYPGKGGGQWKVGAGLSLGHKAGHQQGHTTCPLGEFMGHTGKREGGEGKQETRGGSHDIAKGRTSSHPHAACTLGLRWLSAGASRTLHFRGSPVIIGTLRPVFLQLGPPSLQDSWAEPRTSAKIGRQNRS